MMIVKRYSGDQKSLLSAFLSTDSALPRQLTVIFAAGVFLLLFFGDSTIAEGQDSIDRQALVSRHNVEISKFDSLNSLSVGNGEFAFTVGATGLQTFPEFYERGIPLGTQSQWGWHSFPNPDNYTIEDVAKYYTTNDGRKVPYAVRPDEGRGAKAAHWLRTNPHRLHLGLIGLVLQKENGEEARIGDIGNIDQQLNLWTGKIESSYTVDGVPVQVELLAHQEQDQISVRIESPLVAKERLKVKFQFPYGSDCHVCPGYDWSKQDQHQTVLNQKSEQHVTFERRLDTTRYYMDLQWEAGASVVEKEKHYYQLVPETDGNTFSFNVLFKDDQSATKPNTFSTTEENNQQQWQAFWESGGAIDFSGCTDPRAEELERRVVLSQYLTKIQTSGSLPPQETGLTMNSWYGKFHLEMHWWHGVHYALWNRIEYLENSLDWYTKVMDKARGTAQWQGYEGVRWQKMTGPAGRKSPSSVGEVLVWQQPHPIYFAEELYRQSPSREVSEKYKDRVFATADFMASFVTYDSTDGKYHLAPPVKPAQELFETMNTKDPPFEMAYWHYGLSVAQKWRERLDLPINKEWQKVADNLAPLPKKDNLYLPNALTPDAYTKDKYRHDHPVVLGAYGMLPSAELVDPQIMTNTYHEIEDHWIWESTWGWDYPMIAMAATKLGMPEKAVDALFMDMNKNTYLENGHNYQDERLRLYLPGNGGLLAAVAMMVAGWEKGPDTETPGFPDNGKWNIRWEDIEPMQ